MRQIFKMMALLVIVARFDFTLTILHVVAVNWLE
jgi:hypothetical protein